MSLNAALPGRPARWIAIALLLVFFWRLAATAQVKSATYDETLHVFQAALYWHSFPVYGVVQNPPLVHGLMGLPIRLSFQPAFPEGIEPVSDWLSLSKAFLWQENADGLQMLSVARLVTMGLGVLLGGLVYRWSSQLFGSRLAGLLALALFTLDPNILAHSYLATTDLATAFFYALAGYLIWNYWRDDQDRRARRYLAAGLATGLLLAAKFSGLILMPALLLITIYRLLRARAGAAAWQRAILELAGWLAIAIVLLAASYRFSWETMRLDFMFQQRHQLQGHVSFLLGEFGEDWWYYFPLVWVIKTPLAVLALFSLALGAYAGQRRFSWQTLWPLFLAAGIFAGALASRVNIGYRYLLPMLPPLYVFTGMLGTAVTLRQRAWRWATGLLLFLAAATSVTAHPHYLAYFNRLAGGPDNAWQIVVDSNIDWGQDLQALRGYMEREGIRFVNANWLGTAPLEAYGIRGRVIPGWPALKEYPLYDWFYPPRPAPGFYALSVTQLQGLYLKGDRERFAWFKERPPRDKIGYSLFVYEVPPDGPRVGLALSGIGLGTLDLEEYERAFRSNDVQPRWYDARSSFLWPGGASGDMKPQAWAAVGDGHVPQEPALQALYPAAGAWAQAIGGDGLSYRLFQWTESPIDAQIRSPRNPLLTTSFGWTPESDANAGNGEQNRQPLQEPAVLGDQLELLGFQHLAPGPYSAGQTLQALSYWRVRRTLGEEIKLFLHLLDAQGTLVAQHDGLDVLSDGLLPGDELAQLHTLALPETLAPGTYALQIGAYRAADGTRLLLLDDRSDRLLLDQITVE